MYCCRPCLSHSIIDLNQQGKTSKEYLEIKKMAFLEPKLLHAMLKSLADSIGDYANYQVMVCFALLQMIRVSF